MRILAGFVLVLGLLVTAAPARAGEPVTVVELFTSQGCSACPTADKLLAKLAARDDLLPLSLHVDHWDFIGWRDPFASELFSRRQERYLEHSGLPYVYTPQMVIDGTYQVSGNKTDEVLASIRTAKEQAGERVAIRLDRLSNDRVRVRIAAAPPRYRGEAEILLVRFDDAHATKVTRGENRGHTLVNANVVRLIRPVARWQGAPIDTVVELQDVEGSAPPYCAVLLQERGQGRILGASKVDMRAAPNG